MPVFSYKARNSKGELVKGMLEGEDSTAIAKQLSSLGIIPVEISPKTQSSLDVKLFEERIEAIDIMMFTRQMYSLLKAGLPILSALSGLQSFIKNKTFSKVIGEIHGSLDSGYELSAALYMHPKLFNNFYISMVRVGESTGMLDQIFLRLFEHLEFERDMRNQIKSALRYPMFVILAMLIAIIIVNVFVIPVFADMFAKFGADLPLMTRLLLGFSDFMKIHWHYFLIISAMLWLWLSSYIATKGGKLKWDEFKLKIPIAGKIIYKATMARFARSFSMADKSGIPIIGALTLVAKTVDNEYFCQKLQRMQANIERGESILAAATGIGIFNPLVLQMIAVGEESGSLGDLMSEVADMYQRDVEYEIKTLGSQIEPILIVFLGVLVLILALGIFLPMWDFGSVAIGK